MTCVVFDQVNWASELQEGFHKPHENYGYWGPKQSHTPVHNNGNYKGLVAWRCSLYENRSSHIPNHFYTYAITNAWVTVTLCF